MHNLAITPHALFRLSNYEINKHWFEKFELPKDDQSIRRATIGNTVYIFDRQLEDENTP